MKQPRKVSRRRTLQLASAALPPAHIRTTGAAGDWPLQFGIIGCLTGHDAVRKVVNGRAQKNKVKVDTSNGDQIRNSELENEPPKGTVQLPAPPGTWHGSQTPGRDEPGGLRAVAASRTGVADRRRGGKSASTPGGRGQCTCAEPFRARGWLRSPPHGRRPLPWVCHRRRGWRSPDFRQPPPASHRRPAACRAAQVVRRRCGECP